MKCKPASFFWSYCILFFKTSPLTPRYSNVPGENYEQSLSATDSYPKHTNSSIDVPYNDDNDDVWSEDWDDNSSVSTVQQVSKYCETVFSKIQNI